MPLIAQKWWLSPLFTNQRISSVFGNYTPYFLGQIHDSLMKWNLCFLQRLQIPKPHLVCSSSLFFRTPGVVTWGTPCRTGHGPWNYAFHNGSQRRRATPPWGRLPGWDLRDSSFSHLERLRASKIKIQELNDRLYIRGAAISKKTWIPSGNLT